MNEDAKIISLLEYKGDKESRPLLMSEITGEISKIITGEEAVETMENYNWALGNESHIQNILTLYGLKEAIISGEKFYARDFDFYEPGAKESFRQMVFSFEFLTNKNLFKIARIKTLFDKIKDKGYEN